MPSRMRSALDVSTSSAVFSGSSPRVYCNPSPTWGFEKLPVEGSPYPTAVRSLDRLGLLVVAAPLRPGVSFSRKAGFPANTRGQGPPASASRSVRLIPEPYLVTGFPVVVVSHDPVRPTRAPKSAGRIASSSHGPKPGVVSAHPGSAGADSRVPADISGRGVSCGTGAGSITFLADRVAPASDGREVRRAFPDPFRAYRRSRWTDAAVSSSLPGVPRNLSARGPGRHPEGSGSLDRPCWVSPPCSRANLPFRGPSGRGEPSGGGYEGDPGQG